MKLAMNAITALVHSQHRMTVDPALNGNKIAAMRKFSSEPKRETFATQSIGMESRICSLDDKEWKSIILWTMAI